MGNQRFPKTDEEVQKIRKISWSAFKLTPDIVPKISRRKMRKQLRWYLLQHIKILSLALSEQYYDKSDVADISISVAKIAEVLVRL